MTQENHISNPTGDPPQLQAIAVAAATLALKRAEIRIYFSIVLNITKDAGEIFQMPSHLSPEELRQAAERALEAGDHMTAMDLFGEAAEQAWDQGMTALASVCALRVNDVVAQIAEIERIQLPTYIDKRL